MFVKSPVGLRQSLLHSLSLAVHLETQRRRGLLRHEIEDKRWS